VCDDLTLDNKSFAALNSPYNSKSTFENFLLDEPPDTYQKPHDFWRCPSVALVYGNDGKLSLKKFNGRQAGDVFPTKVR